MPIQNAYCKSLHYSSCLNMETHFAIKRVGSDNGLPPLCVCSGIRPSHDDVIKWNHFPRYWPFVRGIHRYPVNSPHKGQWRGALMFSFICVWINGWVNNREAGELRRYRAHYCVTAMLTGYSDLTNYFESSLLFSKPLAPPNIHQ